MRPARAVRGALGLATLVAALAPAACQPGPGEALPGRVVVVARDPRAHTESVSGIDPSSGRLTALWGLADEVMLAFQPSPDGTRAAYVVTDAATRRKRSLVVRPLAAGSEPTVVASVEGGQGAYWGLAWSRDGARLAYNAQVGELNVLDPANPILPEAWELHIADLGAAGSPADRVVWRIEGAEILPDIYQLEAWDSDAERAAISVRNARLIYLDALYVVDTAAGELAAELDTRAGAFQYLGSPDGRAVALPEDGLSLPPRPDVPGLPTPEATRDISGRGAMRRVDLNTGEAHVVAEVRDTQLAWPVWSPDASILAWLEIEREPLDAALAPGEAEPTPATASPAATPAASPTPVTLPMFARAVRLPAGDELFRLPVRQTNEHVMAFAPDGSALGLVRAGDRRAGEPDRLAIFPVGPLEPTTQPLAEWPLPPGTYRVTWTATP